jgi:hypothetical protein
MIKKGRSSNNLNSKYKDLTQQDLNYKKISNLRQVGIEKNIITNQNISP